MTRPEQRRLVIGALAAVSVAGITVPAALAAGSGHSTPGHDDRAAGASQSSLSSYGFDADAFGSRVDGSSTVRSGTSAASPLTCTRRPGLTRTNHTAATNLGPAGRLGSVTTRTASRSGAAGQIESLSRSHTDATRLLGGLVTAQAVTATASVTHDASGFTRQASSHLTGLVIAGKSIQVSGRPNQQLAVPHVGSVTVNQQSTVASANGVSQTVNGLVIRLGKHNAISAARGTRVVISHATAALYRPDAALLTGTAYGSQVSASGAAHSGRTFLRHLSCATPAGKASRTTGAGIDAAGALRTGNVVSSAIRSADGGGTSAQIANVHLLGGLLTARAVTARAAATQTASGLSFSGSGSTLTDLVVDGHHINRNVKPNTKMSLAGIGTLWLRRTVHTDRGVTVRMIDLTLGHSKDGLRKGTEIVIGSAAVSERG